MPNQHIHVHTQKNPEKQTKGSRPKPTLVQFCHLEVSVMRLNEFDQVLCVPLFGMGRRIWKENATLVSNKEKTRVGQKAKDGSVNKKIE